jgi:hypothetical protein
VGAAVDGDSVAIVWLACGDVDAAAVEQGADCARISRSAASRLSTAALISDGLFDNLALSARPIAAVMMLSMTGCARRHWVSSALGS